MTHAVAKGEAKPHWKGFVSFAASTDVIRPIGTMLISFERGTLQLPDDRSFSKSQL